MLGMALILAGGFRAARAMGAVDRWWVGAKRWLRARWGVVIRLWKRYVLRRDPVVIEAKAAGVGVSAGGATVAVGEAPWDAMDQDEKLSVLRKRIDGLRDQVKRNHEQITGRVGDVERRLGEFESAVDEQLGGHDVRLEDILRFELVGTVLVLAGG